MKKKFGLLLATLLVASTAAFAACDFTNENSGSEESSSGTTSSSENSSSVTNTYTVTFNTDGGSTVDPVEVEEGAKATKPADPTKMGYTFGGWYLGETEFDFETLAITTNVTLTAKWTAVTYMVTVDKLEGEDVTVEFTVENRIAKLAEIEAMLTADNAEWDYEWTNLPTELALENGNTITEGRTKKTYTVKFVDENGTELKSETLEYGATPVAPADPTKEATAQYTYTFAGWDTEVVAVTGTATYTATYSSTVNEYVVKFVNDDGTELKSETLEYGAMPVAPADPTKEADDEYTYTFAGWTPAVVSVTGTATYTATYDSDRITYTVNHYFMNSDMTTYTLVKTETVNAEESMTKAVAIQVNGYAANAIEQEQILANSSTVVDIYYTKDAKVEGFETITTDGTYVDHEGNTFTSGSTKFAVGKEGETTFNQLIGGYFGSADFNGKDSGIVTDAYSGNKALMYTNGGWNDNGIVLIKLTETMKAQLAVNDKISVRVKLASNGTFANDYNNFTFVTNDGVDFEGLTSTSMAGLGTKDDGQWVEVSVDYAEGTNYIGFRYVGTTENSTHNFKLYVDEIRVVKAEYTTYTVNHYKKDADGNVGEVTETETIENAVVGKKTNAVAKEYENYVADAFEQVVVESNGVTVVNIYYTQKCKYTVNHYLMNSDMTTYTVKSEVFYAEKDTTTEAVALNIVGYEAGAVEQTTVTSDNLAKVDIYYTKDAKVEGFETITLTGESVDADGGEFNNAQDSVRVIVGKEGEAEWNNLIIYSGCDQKGPFEVTTDTYSGNQALVYTNGGWLDVGVMLIKLSDSMKAQLAENDKIIVRVKLEDNGAMAKDYAAFTFITNDGVDREGLTSTSMEGLGNKGEWLEVSVDYAAGTNYIGFSYSGHGGNAWNNFKLYVDEIRVVKAEYTTYTVNHYKKDADGNVGEVTETETVENAVVGKKTNAVAKEYVGYVADAFEQVVVESNGVTVVNIYYTQKCKYTVNHYLMNSDMTTYTVVKSEEFYALKDATTEAVALNVNGYTAGAVEQTTVTSDNLAKVDIYYTKDAKVEGFETITLTGESVDADGGEFNNAQDSVRVIVGKEGEAEWNNLVIYSGSDQKGPFEVTTDTYSGSKALVYTNGGWLDSGVMLIKLSDSMKAQLAENDKISVRVKLVSNGPWAKDYEAFKFITNDGVDGTALTSTSMEGLGTKDDGQWVEVSVDYAEGTNYIGFSYSGHSGNAWNNFKLYVDEIRVVKAEYTTYTVNHYKKDADGNVGEVTETETIENAVVGKKTNAVAKEYENYVADAFEQVVVESNGVTVVNIYYTQKCKYTVNHHFMNSDMTTYTVKSEEFYAAKDSTTQAVALNVVGYEAGAVEQTIVTNDNLAKVDIYYTKDAKVEGFETITLTGESVDADGGEFSNAADSVRVIVGKEGEAEWNNLVIYSGSDQKGPFEVTTDTYSGSKALVYTNGGWLDSGVMLIKLSDSMKEQLAENDKISVRVKLVSNGPWAKDYEAFKFITNDGVDGTALTSTSMEGLGTKDDGQWVEVSVDYAEGTNYIGFSYSGHSGNAWNNFKLYVDEIRVVKA